VLTQLRPADVGFHGEMFSPDVPTSRPAVLVIGGSGGGLLDSSYIAAGLADAGFPALAIAYFEEPGLPDRLEAIPLEYFVTALRWFAGQPGVDPAAVVTWGVSRGSEAALLLGVNFPDLVHGVAALVPGNVVLCAYPTCPQPAWTLNGTPLPFQTVFGPIPTTPEAAIPVEDIIGPTFLVCGENDNTWPSCPMAEAVVDRLDQQPDPPSHVLLQYAGVGHEIGFLRPASGEFSTGTSPYPPTPAATEKARKRAWPRALRFLAELAA
jgi:dienelactone hydrolase